MRERKRNKNNNGLAVLAAGLVLALILPSPGRGDESKERKTAFKAGAGAVFRTAQNFDTGFLYQAGFFTLISRRLGLEVLITGNRAKMEEPPAPLSAGEMATTQVLLSGQYRFLPGKTINPYAIFGVEFNFLHYWPADEAEENKHDFVDRFAPHFGVGLEWALSDWLALNADAKYSLIKTWVEELPREGPLGEVNPDEVDKIDLSALTVTLGLKFYF